MGYSKISLTFVFGTDLPLLSAGRPAMRNRNKATENIITRQTTQFTKTLNKSYYWWND